MRLQLLCFLLATGFLTSQEPEDLAKSSFPVRLTPEEEAGQNGTAPCRTPKSSCCTPAAQPSCTPTCCPTNNNCPTLMREAASERCWTGPYFYVDWLYWQTRQEGMQYATEYDPLAGDMGGAHTLELDIDWASGWRVGLGIDTTFDKWDFNFDFTRICPEGKHHQTGVLFPYLLYQGDLNVGNVTIVHEASAEWKIFLNSWDLEMGRQILVSDHFAFRPHIGMKQAWILQKAFIDYFGGPSAPTGEYNLSYHNHFQGFGVRGGLDSLWTLGYGFSIYGNMALALLWGETNLKQYQILLGNSKIGYRDKTNVMKPVAEATIGLSWDRRYYHDRFIVGLDAALETQYWWGQNIADRFTSSIIPISVKTIYDLSFLGLTLGIRFGF